MTTFIEIWVKMNSIYISGISIIAYNNYAILYLNIIEFSFFFFNSDSIRSNRIIKNERGLDERICNKFYK